MTRLKTSVERPPSRWKGKRARGLLAATALSAIICMSPATYAQGTRGAWLRGTWEGTGYQIDTGTTWTMRLTVRGGKYLIEYPSLNCAGSWRRLSLDSMIATFRERITVGRGECVDQGRVVIERLNGRQVAYRFSQRGTSEVSASAILNRKK